MAITVEKDVSFNARTKKVFRSTMMVFITGFLRVVVAVLGFSLLVWPVAHALTFKTDGSVVQSDGTVTRLSARDRFFKRFDEKLNWPISTASQPTAVAKPGYFGNGYFVPGTPLLSLYGVRKGDDYVEKISTLNGFQSKSSFIRFIVSLSTPEFLKTLDLTEAQALMYSQMLTDVEMSTITNDARFTPNERKLLKIKDQTVRLTDQLKLESVFSNRIESNLQSQIESSVDEAVEESIEQSIEESIQESLEESFNSAIEDMVKSGSLNLDFKEVEVSDETGGESSK